MLKHTNEQVVWQDGCFSVSAEAKVCRPTRTQNTTAWFGWELIPHSIYTATVMVLACDTKCCAVKRGTGSGTRLVAGATLCFLMGVQRLPDPTETSGAAY
jgi:hypothetical protein